MIVQWVIKGITGDARGIDDQQAQQMVDSGGICSNWLRTRGQMGVNEIPTKLTRSNLDLHVNQYSLVRRETPFISLAAGCVER